MKTSLSTLCLSAALSLYSTASPAAAVSPFPQDVEAIYGAIQAPPVLKDGEIELDAGGEPIYEKVTVLSTSKAKRFSWLNSSEGTQLYSDLACEKECATASFLEEYFEVWRDGETVLLAKSDNPVIVPDDSTSGHATAISGYARQEDFIESVPGKNAFQCERTDSNVDRKALIVHKWADSPEKKYDANGEVVVDAQGNPAYEQAELEKAFLLNAPGSEAKKIGELNLYEILYVYEMRSLSAESVASPGEDSEEPAEQLYYLVGGNPYFYSEIGEAEGKIRGWVSGSRVFIWDHREAIEFNKSPEALAWRTDNDSPIKLYATPEDAANREEALFEEDLGTPEWHHEMQRYPIITPQFERGKSIWEVGVIGDSYSGDRRIAASVEAQIQGKIEELSLGRGSLDVLVVVDASGSMTEFYSSIGATVQSLQTAIASAQIEDVRYAVSYYRDYTEDLNPNSWSTYYRDFDTAAGFGELFDQSSPRWIGSAGGQMNPCVFAGIVEGINAVSWRPKSSRAVILIGDMGNAESAYRQALLGGQEGVPGIPGTGGGEEARYKSGLNDTEGDLPDKKGYTLDDVAGVLNQFGCELYPIQAYPGYKGKLGDPGLDSNTQDAQMARATFARIEQFYRQSQALFKETKAARRGRVTRVLEASGTDLSASLQESFQGASDELEDLRVILKEIQEGKSLDEATADLLEKHGINEVAGDGTSEASHYTGGWGLFIKDKVIEGLASEGLDVDVFMAQRVQMFAFAHGEETLTEAPHPQFMTRILMSVRDVHSLLSALRVIERDPLTPDNVDVLWMGIVNALVGDPEHAFTFDETVPLSEYFTKSLGLPTRSEYLKMSIRELKTLEPAQLSEWSENIIAKVQALSNYSMNKAADGKQTERHIFTKNNIQFLWVPVELFP